VQRPPQCADELGFQRRAPDGNPDEIAMRGFPVEIVGHEQMYS